MAKKDSSSSKSKHSSKHSSKSKSTKHSKKIEKEEKHLNGSKVKECMNMILSKVNKDKNKYTSRYIASTKSSVGSKFGRDYVLAAIDSLKGKDLITFSHKDNKKKGGKGYYVIQPLARKAA
jgi:DNA-binding protein Fis